MIRISYSAASDYLTCPRKYYYRWLLGKRAVAAGTSRSLLFGRAFHEAQAAWWSTEGDPATRLIAAIQAWYEHSSDLRPEDRVLGEVLLIGYAAHWSDAMLRYQMIPLAEKRVTAPLLGPDGKPVDDQVLVAVFDVVAYTATGETVLIEHKTTRSDVSPGTRYWERIELNLQADLYALVAEDLGRHVDYVLWDVVRVPEISRLPATPLHQREVYQKSGPWGKKGEYKRNVRLVEESLEEYEARVTQLILDNPTAYFARRELYRDPAQLDAARADLYGVGAQISAAKAAGTFPRNTDSCHKYGYECEFLPVCSGAADINDERLYAVRPRPEAPDPWEEK